MRTRVDSRQLRRHVVRVEQADGRAVLGTGFFVAPGWVLTAAHVVYDAANGVALDRVVVVPADADVGVDAVAADVLARSAPPVDTALWPYPDLALLRLRHTSAWVGTHPCVWLAGVQPLPGQCHAFGFPPREEGAAPVGAPASFDFEGVTGDDFFQLKAGQAAPGLSGAPLVCPAAERSHVVRRCACRPVHDGARTAHGRPAAHQRWPLSAPLDAAPGLPGHRSRRGSGTRGRLHRGADDSPSRTARRRSTAVPGRRLEPRRAGVLRSDRPGQRDLHGRHRPPRPPPRRRPRRPLLGRRRVITGPAGIRSCHVRYGAGGGHPPREMMT
ncbi:trypsin-like peptidase domain-containing protein [Micromonospora sp. NPDC000442]|uniref:trypsin-like peptidase domain-containing protein n=1 Tax=Micromonospora sp. NPDC000442 TaxID=3364217 RepID=UPI003681347E